MLREKHLDFKITYIDIRNKPEWLLKISPLGKVPVLKVDDTVLFESAVIAEYLDEAYPPSMHPADPLRKAHNRAWMEFSSELLVTQHKIMTVRHEEDFNSAVKDMAEKLSMLENSLDRAPFFNGKVFSVVDAFFAPGFVRLAELDSYHPLGLYASLPKTASWSRELLDRESVKLSILPDFSRLFRLSIKATGGFLAGIAQPSG